MRAPELGGLRLDEVMPHRLLSAPQRNGSGESETAARQQGGIFVGRALPPANVDEYLKIRVKNRQRLARIVGDISFHEDKARTAGHGATTGREDGNRLIVVEIGRASCRERVFGYV